MIDNYFRLSVIRGWMTLQCKQNVLDSLASFKLYSTPLSHDRCVAVRVDVGLNTSPSVVLACLELQVRFFNHWINMPPCAQL